MFVSQYIRIIELNNYDAERQIVMGITHEIVIVHQVRKYKTINWATLQNPIKYICIYQYNCYSTKLLT